MPTVWKIRRKARRARRGVAQVGKIELPPRRGSENETGNRPAGPRRPGKGERHGNVEQRTPREAQVLRGKRRGESRRCGPPTARVSGSSSGLRGGRAGGGGLGRGGARALVTRKRFGGRGKAPALKAEKRARVRRSSRGGDGPLRRGRRCFHMPRETTTSSCQKGQPRGHPGW